MVGFLNSGSTYNINTVITASPFLINDFVYHDSSVYIGTLNNNNIINQIHNGLIHKKICDRSEKVIFETPNDVGTIPSYVYNTRHDMWVFNIGQYGSVFGGYGGGGHYNTSYLIDSGGKPLSLTHISPQSLRQYRSEYVYPDYNILSGVVNGSIYNFDSSGSTKNTYHVNYNTLSLDSDSGNVFYGGVFNNNHIDIFNYQVKENINNHIIWSVNMNNPSGTFNSCSVNSEYYGSNWTGIYGFTSLLPVTNIDVRYYSRNLDLDNNNTFSIYKDSLSYFNSPIHTSGSVGDVVCEYSCRQDYHNCYIDLYPAGFRILPTSTISATGIIFTSLTIYPYYIEYFPRRTYTLDVLSSSVLFSSGQVAFSASDSLSQIETKLSSITPYGVSCYGQTISNMFVIAKGNITSSNLASGLAFNSFSYDTTLLEFKVKYNKINNHGSTTGKINNSGDIIWQHNHGQDLIKYNEIIVGSSILYPSGNQELGIFEPPNHYGEVYRVQYDKNTDKLYTTGNLVKKKLLNTGLYYLMPSSIVNFIVSSVLIPSADYFAQFGVRCYTGNPFFPNYSVNCPVATSVFTGLQTVYVPTGFIISNFDPQCTSGLCSGLLTYKMNSNSLQYLQNSTSDLTCGNKFEIPSYLVKYNGEYPNITEGSLPMFIHLEE